MKLSLNWASQVSNVELRNIGDDKLIEKIGAQLGAVDEVDYWGPRFDGIVVVKVLECIKHDNADKLSVCVIDDGGKVQNVERDSNGHVQVVCGAPNVHAGMLAAWIPPGVTVPSTLGKEPLVIEAREIRGQKSNGMLASLHELGISDDHSGILEIKADKNVDEELTKLGTDFKQLYKLDDVVVDIENKMFTHRPDLFGVLGCARELAGIQQLGFKSPDIYLNQPQFEPKNDLSLEVNVQDIAIVPRFVAVAIKDVNVGPSPVWLQAALVRVGIRPINNVVDITNFVMHLTAQPLHAYDADKLRKVSKNESGILRLETRQSRHGDKVNLLNGKALELQDDSTILITSNDVPVGIGGVMGGADTEVDENTNNIVLECASFDMYSIRRTAMQYGLFTDAVTRFTKGQSPLQNDRVVAMTLGLISKHAGGQQASDVIDIHGELPQLSNVKVNKNFINARLGSQFSAEEMANLLRNVEFNVDVNGDDLSVTSPFWRTDIVISEDIVEEIGRLHGYDQIPLVLPKRSTIPAATDSLMELISLIRNHLSASGANEVLTYTFVHGDLMDKVGQKKEQAYQIANAISPDLQYYRLSLLPSLLDKVHPNTKQGFGEFALFEINPVHAIDYKDDDGLPAESQRLALVFAAADKSAQNYSGAVYYQAKKYLIQLLNLLGINDLEFQPAEQFETSDALNQAGLAPFEKKRSAVIRLNGGEVLGVIGEFRNPVRQKLKLPNFTAGFELNLGPILKLNLSGANYTPIPRFPRVEQDMTLKVDSRLTYDELTKFISQAISEQINEALIKLSPKDIYQNDTDKDHKHITLHLEIASYERTLTAEEVNRLLNQAAEKAKAEFGAERI